MYGARLGIGTVLFIGFLQAHAAPISIPKHIGSSDGQAVYDQSRPSEYPYISGITFRMFCDHQVCCTIDSIDPDKIKLGDTVYVADWYIDWFFTNVHPQIQHQYILVSGDSDELHPSLWFNETRILYDKKVGAWFCKDFILSNHPKLFKIPVGPTALNWHFPLETFSAIAKNASVSNKIESPLLYSSHLTLINDPARRYVRELFINQSFCHTEKMSIDRVPFWHVLSKFKFVLAPWGTVMDSPRVWEALSLNTIPICRHSPLDDLYEGTSTVLVHSWEEINEDFLKNKYSEVQEKLLSGEITNTKTHFDYWANAINQVKHSIKQGLWEGADLEAAPLFDAKMLSDIKEILYEMPNDQGVSPSQCLFIIYGKFLGLRAFQLSHTLPEFMKILAIDPYAMKNQEHQNLMMSLAKEESKYLFNSAAEFALPDVDIKKYIQWLKNCRVKMFIDLTHYRHKFTDKLWSFYQMLPTGSVICGNMADDPYVKMQLDAFSSCQSVVIERKSNLWCLRRPYNNYFGF